VGSFRTSYLLFSQKPGKKDSSAAINQIRAATVLEKALEQARAFPRENAALDLTPVI